MGPPRKHRIPAEDVGATLDAAGLEAVLVEEELPHQYAVAGRKR